MAEGWYDPKTLEKAEASDTVDPVKPSNKRFGHWNATSHEEGHSTNVTDDEYGPSLPGQKSRDLSGDAARSARPGPSIPNFQDLQVKREADEEDAAEFRRLESSTIRSERLDDRRLQKERLDDLVPKAAPGTRDRQLEKKRETADSNRAFASVREQGDVELRDADVMGDEDHLSDLKRMKVENERKKNEREVRREEVLRARRAEREERVAGMRQKEEKTMSILKEIARARFGDNG